MLTPKLVEFAKWAISEGPWEGCSLDGGEIQDKAVELGLLDSNIADAENKDVWESIDDIEEGDVYYTFSAPLSGVRVRSTAHLAGSVPSRSDLRRRTFESIEPMHYEALCFTEAENGAVDFWGTVETQEQWNKAARECAFWVLPDDVAALAAQPKGTPATEGAE